jgi:outer membrane lipoprotein-sorting protein
MSLIVLLSLALAVLPQIPPSMDNLIDRTFESFAKMKTFSADYEQTMNRKGSVSGHLYLMTGRKMRFDYVKGRDMHQLISDGKTVYDVDPAGKQVFQEPVSKSLDERIPLMFLLGNPDLRKEFKEFQEVSGAAMIPGNRVLRLIPNKQKDVQRVEIEVEGRNSELRRLLLTYVDGTESELIFRNVQTNGTLNESIFKFQPPPDFKDWDVVKGLSR